MEGSTNGIAIMGLNGSGKSTLAHALAKVIGYYEIDVQSSRLRTMSRPSKRRDQVLSFASHKLPNNPGNTGQGLFFDGRIVFTTYKVHNKIK